MNEADTCRTLVTPRLRTAGWTDAQIREQVTFTHGRIVPSGGQVACKVQKRADYLLYYQSKYKVAVIKAKDDTHRAVDGPVPPIEKQVWFDELSAKVDALPALCSSGRLQSASGEALSASMPSILDKAFKGEL
jgi:hypothetical protein